MRSIRAAWFIGLAIVANVGWLTIDLNPQEETRETQFIRAWGTDTGRAAEHILREIERNNLRKRTEIIDLETQVEARKQYFRDNNLCIPAAKFDAAEPAARDGLEEFRCAD